jgi:hypothetical protein
MKFQLFKIRNVSVATFGSIFVGYVPLSTDLTIT